MCELMKLVALRGPGQIENGDVSTHTHTHTYKNKMKVIKPENIKHHNTPAIGLCFLSL